MGKDGRPSGTQPVWHRRPRYPVEWNATHRLWLLFAGGVFTLLKGGSSALVRPGPIGNRLLGGLAVLAAVTLLAVVGLYLHWPATLRHPPEPMLREDLRDLARWIRRRLAGRRP